MSTLDLLSREGFTLFVGSHAAPPSGSRLPTRSPRASGFPISVIVVSAEEIEWAAVREVDESGAVLVRPDSKVAWRAATAPPDPTEALRQRPWQRSCAVRCEPLDEDPAEPYLERIRAAAARLGQ